MKKNKPNGSWLMRILHARWFYAVNFALVVFISISFGREFIHSRDIAKQIRDLEQQAQALQAQNLAITELKNAVQTQSFVEQEARLKLGLKKPGETLVILKGEEKPSAARESSPAPAVGLGEELATTSSTESSLANSQKWWYYFFNKQAYREAKSL